MFFYFLAFILTFVLQIYAQSTVTTLDAAGHSVIEVISLNPQGLPVTQVIQTITSSTTSTSTSSTAPTTPAPAGPVAQPAPTTGTPGAPTPYTYTTVIGGITSVVADIFTPTSPATSPFTPPAQGTIYDYSSWYSANGPPKTKNGASSSAIPAFAFLAGVVAISGWMTFVWS